MGNVTIVGLGYVGLPLALLADKKGYTVTGVDIDSNRIAKLKNRLLPTEENDLNSQLKNSSIIFSQDFESVKKADYVVICVPTPVDNAKMPNLKPLRSAVEAVTPNLKESSLLIIESTINPGVCDEVLIPLIEKLSNLKISTSVHIAHCPERINPGDTTWNVENIPRVVGAESEAGLTLAIEFYESILVADIKSMTTIKEAEAVKIVENSFRDINIAFVNELAKSFHLMGINLENVIDGAATKPFAFMPHRPGCGVGGHCIPVDPYFLIEHAKGFGFDHKFLQIARDINESMPEFTISLLEEAHKKLSLDKRTVNVLILGQTYKPDVGDCRESPAITIYNSLVSLGYKVKRHEPFSKDKSDFDKLEEALEFADSVILATDHRQYKNLKPKHFNNAKIKVLIDGRNSFRRVAKDFYKNNIYYTGIGTN